VDFVLEEGDQLVALEIKMRSIVTHSDASGIRGFRNSLNKGQRFSRGIVLHAGPARPLDADILALPWGWICGGMTESGLGERGGGCEAPAWREDSSARFPA
jgi:predicted AAA+ superfamily ATPase